MSRFICAECHADVAEIGHFPECSAVQDRETDPRYAGLEDIMVEATALNRVAKTPRTPNPDELRDGPTSETWGKGRPA